MPERVQAPHAGASWRGASWLPLLLATVVGGLVMSLVNDRFATSYNLFVVLQEAATYALIGFAVMVVLAVRDLSLAVGGIGSLCCVTFGWLVDPLGLPVVVGIVVALLLGLVLGLVNGVLITASGLSGFVVTLASGATFTGLALGATKSAAFSAIPGAWTAFGQGRFGLVPYLGLVALGVGLLLHALFRWLPAGRAMLTTGGNPEAARLVGISNVRQIVGAHALSGLLAALAAVLYVGRLGSATPDLGANWVILSFAVPIIGGTAMLGGRVSVAGALIAAVVLAGINNALILLNVSQYGVLFSQGLLILLAVLAGRLQGVGALAGRTRQVAA